MDQAKDRRRQWRIALARVIKNHRQNAGKTQPEVWTATSITKNSYLRTEAGDRAVTAPELESIAVYLGVSAEQMMSEARELVDGGKIPSRAQRAADVWHSTMSPRWTD